MNFGASAFTGVVPVGFSSWGGTINPSDYDYVHIALSNGNLTATRLAAGSSGRHNITIRDFRLTLQCLRSTATWPYGGSDPPFQPSLQGPNADGWDLSHHAIPFDANCAHDNVRISGCEIDGSKGELIAYAGTAFTNLTIENCYLHDCNADMISCMAGPMFVRNNRIDACTNIIENSPFNDDMEVSGNYCTNSTNGVVITNQSVSGGDAAISGKTVIRDNFIIKAFTFGIFIQACAKQVWAHHNTLVDCGAIGGSGAAAINISLNDNGNFTYTGYNVFVEDNQLYCDSVGLGQCVIVSDVDPNIIGKYVRRNRAIITSNAFHNNFNFASGVTYSLLTNDSLFIEDNDFSVLTNPAFLRVGGPGNFPKFRRNISAQAEMLPDSTVVFQQFDKTSDTTLANVPLAGPKIILGQGTNYVFNIKLFVSANASGGAKVAIGFPGSPGPSSFFAIAKLLAGTSIVASGTAAAVNTLIAGATAAVDLIEISGSMTTGIGGSSAGALNVQFAQNASFGTPSSVLSGSNIEVWEAQVQSS
jgi:hypothetical protein